MGVLIAVHVLGHLRETVTLASADWRERSARRRAGRGSSARSRAILLAATVVLGVVVAIVSLGWIGTWNHGGDFGRH